MLIGFAITEHCNLRCPHCIRDDVTHVRSLEPDLIASVLDQALSMFGSVTASFTGGEPLLHAQFDTILEHCAKRDVPYRFVSNGWHIKRVIPALRRVPPVAVRLSLSGASVATHDADRGRGSLERVLLAVALLTNERIPAYLSIVIDRRNRHELRAAADLAEQLGCVGIGYILPQPTPGSAARDSDLGPEKWLPTKLAIDELAAEAGRQSKIFLEYGHPYEGAEQPCETFTFDRIYVDTQGRLCTCCQLSNFGFNETEVVADLRTESLADAYDQYQSRVQALRNAQRPDPRDPRVTDPFPCLRCCAENGKLGWLADHPASSWYDAVQSKGPAARSA
jgi:MoaA/NifB/PqqE/SkfB family radical SAM enzyme